ncbi:DNA polymerase I [Symbiobacterium terraclitae]|uniref:DNA polymerase I n=1 Tax=Symbiobacterium terraclitae TaxID=557451 RepID=UPI0035B510B6
MAKAEKLLLLDGNSLANRAFYALQLFSTSDGVYTNAVYGFLTMLFKLLDEEKPDYIAVAFDKGRQTFRTALYEEYKGTRKAPPDEFRPQLDLLREVLTALNIPWFRVDNYEADDLLGTLARQATERGIETLIVTGDRDALQLVGEKVTVALTRKGISETVRYDPATLKADLGLTPAQVIELKALMGDASDNIPGVPGVGEKTALKLLAEYGTVEGVYAHLDQIKGALQTKLRENRDKAELSRTLATIDTNAPVELKPAELRVREPDYPAANALFRRLEFKSLLPRVTPPEGSAAAEAVAGQAAAGAVEVVAARRIDQPGALRLTGEAPVLAEMTVDPGNPGRPRPVGLAAGDPPAWLEGEALADPAGLLDPAARLVGHDLKPLYNWLYARGVTPPEPAFDTALAAYLLDPGRSAYDLADLCRQHGLGELPAGSDPDARATRASVLPELRRRMEAELASRGMDRLYWEVELPLMPILAEMEAAGVGIDPAALHEMSGELERRILQLSQEIYEVAGVQFNISSPKQLGDVLFGKLGLPHGKKTRTGGYSTDAEVLEELAADYPIAQLILDYRTLTKLKGTYVDALGQLIARDGRIHTTFAQTVAETGRLASKDPNLQNIPIRIEEGRRIRKAFIARPGHVLLSADYSQIELRVVAHYSGDPALREAFLRDQDIHTRTAAEVFGVPMDQVTPDMRRQAKAVNFGLIYGQTDFGLARAVGISRAEAKAFIETYFTKFAGVKRYMEEKKAEAREKGYVTTLDGRRRPLPEINHRVFTIRQNAERMAINTPIQGTAADLMKRAMIAVRRAMREEGLTARMILQVHDELVFECPVNELDRLARLVKREMEGAMKLDVPLKVEAKAGPDWYSVQPYEVGTDA